MRGVAGVSCRSYHAGLPASQRAQILTDWTKAKVPVIAATIAFGERHLNMDADGHEAPVALFFFFAAHRSMQLLIRAEQTEFAMCMYAGMGIDKAGDSRSCCPHGLALW